MRYLNGILCIAVFALFSCGGNNAEMEKAKQDSLAKIKLDARVKYLKAIDDAEAQMRADKNYDPRLATAALKAYNDFCVTFPDDSMTAEYLFRASDLAQGSKNYQQATVFLETIIEKHKGYKKYAASCFMAAYIYDSFLENVNHGDDRARQLYKFVIDNYPNTKYAEDSKVLIKYIGKPDSVMINDIIKKGGKK